MRSPRTSSRAARARSTSRPSGSEGSDPRRGASCRLRPEPFVPRGSVVREIWGDADTILLVFAGAAAEFALNRAVDWLFFTGAIPGDPIGRLFRTAAHAQGVVFATRATAEQTLARIRAAHDAVERARGDRIPEWAHRDVLYFLIDYSERGHSLVRRPLTAAERDDLYDVFRRVGEGLEIPSLPASYAAWRVDRERHLRQDLATTTHTAALYARYRARLGAWRYELLRHVQAALVPPLVAELLRLPRAWAGPLAIGAYRGLRRLGASGVARLALVPRPYLSHVRRLDHPGDGIDGSE